MPCLLCTQSADGAVGNIEFASEEAYSLGLRCIIEKHFWLKIPDSSIGYVCGSCWEQLFLFHNFYVSVEQAHKALEQTVLEEASPPEEAFYAHGRQLVKSEQVESVAAAVKRRRGRPRKTENASNDASEELKSVLEQINLNEIKIEFPEADLTIADVLEDQEELDFLPNDCISGEEDEDESEGLEEPQPKIKRKVRGRPRGRGKARLPERPKKKSLQNIKKSQEFNDFIREHYKVQCHICSKPMEGFSEMLVHVRREHKQRGYSMCCNRKFWKRGVLVDHLRRHQDPELFKCSICARVMGQRRSLELHMRMHEIKTRGRLYHCDHCSKSFYSSVVCERHKLTHIPREQWQVKCTHCEKTFPTQYTMQQHVKLVHLNLYAKICDVCGKSIRGREALARHMEEHTGAPQSAIKCHLCDSMLTTKYGLARHIKMMHTEENLQPMQCEICLKISPSLQAHQHHIKYTHKTARSHQCPMCEKAFKRPNELREHMTTHTGEVLYTCPHCPQTFNSNANMHAHRKKVHRKEWEENRHQRINRPRKSDTIIAVSVRKTTEARQDEGKGAAGALVLPNSPGPEC
ncbi:LOW QUALITY PROTEIN: transcription factor grauzone [Drosophila ficusphila]|uniref:LOW QUALITY PROTEIN: transcription factor grauzone n=1 Tax=Drosophila ficusphila TaxID=30025 RepID=UPI001C89F651|nr:LOW QUALITY PROTEIN: transcription factor grauzone [Drosophila ficusphila]